MNFLPSPASSQPANITPKPGPTSTAGIRPHVSTIHLCPNTGIPERRVHAPGKGEGRREELARDRVLGRHRRQSLLNACAASVGKEDPGPTLIPLSVQYFLCHSISGGKGNVSCQRQWPASHLEGWDLECEDSLYFRELWAQATTDTTISTEVYPAKHQDTNVT